MFIFYHFIQIQIKNYKITQILSYFFINIILLLLLCYFINKILHNKNYSNLGFSLHIRTHLRLKFIHIK